MKITYGTPIGVHPSKMEIGDVAQIISVKVGSCSSRLQGALIVKGHDSLQVIGDVDFWSNTSNPVNIELVRILKPGDKIEF